MYEGLKVEGGLVVVLCLFLEYYIREFRLSFDFVMFMEWNFRLDVVFQ